MLYRLMSERGIDLDSIPIQPADPALKSYPLSFAQERLWFLYQLYDGHPSDNVPVAFRIEGKLDYDALEQSCNVLIHRHKILGACFENIEGQVVQNSESKYYKIELQELPVENPTDAEGTIRSFLTEEAQISFNITCWPLFKVKLFKISGEDHILFVNMHHIISDGWSLGVFFRELEITYASIIDNEEPLLPELPIQYIDYCMWQRQWLIDNFLTSELSFWKQHLEGSMPLLELPTDRSRPATQSFKGSKYPISIPAELYNGLKTLAKTEGCTLFMVLCAAFQTLLSRYTGSEDIIIGTPIANRDRPEINNLIGLFLNLLVLRTDLSGSPSFLELLGRVKEVTSNAFKNEKIPFEKLVEVLRPKREMSYHPVFQVLLQVSNGFELNLRNSVVTPFHFDSGTAQYDLALHLFEGKDGFQGHFEYSTDLFDETTIKRFANSFELLLYNILDAPHLSIERLCELHKDEAKFLLHDVNKTFIERPNDKCLYQLFEEQAKRVPGKVAIDYQGHEITYEQLNSKANQLARYLIENGVGPDQPIGIYMNRSIDMVIGLLGILKSGAAYLPMDPMFPRSRLTFMLEDTDARLLLTQSDLAEDFPEYNGRVIPLDQEWGIISKHSDQPVEVLADSSTLAYIIYTSGSTGKPKGVQIEHKSVVNFLRSMQKTPGLVESDILLSVTTLSFDISILEIFLPIITGAKLVLVSKEDSMDGLFLINKLQEMAVTVMQATPTTWKMMLDAGWKSKLNLKVLCGGEALPKDLAFKVLPLCDSFWNVYGPTETTIWSTVKQVKSHDEIITIGRPIDNTSVYVLDKIGRIAPVGVVGELHIGGAGIARGYLNREELTRERFIEDPFTPYGGKYLYKTGDLARVLDNGEIECLGRLDDQIKIRGFRVELGEIETLVKKHPGVHDAVIAIKNDPNGNPRLVAYLIPVDNLEPDIDNIKNFLKDQLPGYMIPAVHLFVKEFPMTPNGKIDRNALPEPTTTKHKSHEVGHGAKDKIEEELIALWEELLNVRPININDDFFDLGGHSLLAAQMFRKIEVAFGKSIPLATLFKSPTIAFLASILRDKGKVKWSSLVDINTRGSNTPLFLVHGAEGNVLLYRELAQQLSKHNQPVYGLQSQGLNPSAQFTADIEKMASHYVGEIIERFPNGPYLLGGYCLGGVIALEMARQLTAIGKQVDSVIMLETYNEFVKGQDKRPEVEEWSILLQNMYFHLENFIRADNKSGFLTAKLKVSMTRMTIAWELFLKWLKNGFKNLSEQEYVHLRLAKLNDRALMEYQPQQFDGEIVLFRPKSYFKGWGDEKFGWTGIARRGIKVVTLPMGPRAMLVEPFVKNLAHELRTFLASENHKSQEPVS